MVEGWVVTGRWMGCKLKLSQSEREGRVKNTDETVRSDDEGVLLCVGICVTC